LDAINDKSSGSALSQKAIIKKPVEKVANWL
jgi:hypothetical protein